MWRCGWGIEEIKELVRGLLRVDMVMVALIPGVKVDVVV
jgi:hypothetical protein